VSGFLVAALAALQVAVLAAVVVLLVRKARARTLERVEAFLAEREGKGDRVVLRDDGAVCRGFRSGMKLSSKGNGVLLMMGDGLHFFPYFGRDRFVPWEGTSSPRTARKVGMSWNSRYSFVVDYDIGDEKGEVGWIVAEPDEWTRAAEAALSVLASRRSPGDRPSRA